jgi:hypothetical protein
MARRTVTVSVEIDKETHIRRPNLRGMALNSQLESDDGATMQISVEGTLEEIRELEQRTEDKWNEEDMERDETADAEPARNASADVPGATETGGTGENAPNSGPARTGLQESPTGGTTTANTEPSGPTSPTDPTSGTTRRNR